MTKYRIMTEDRNRDGIRAILDQYFDGYTLIPGFGCWKGQAEASLTIEVIPPEPTTVCEKHTRKGKKGCYFCDHEGAEHSPELAILDIARSIKTLNAQESVLIEKSEVEVEFV